jgi:DNA repair exonuclease SbcCD ATPase subunit
LERLGTQNAEKLKRLQAMLEVNLKFISKTAREHAENIGELKALKRQREEYHALSGECPTCHQQVDTLHINTHLSRIQRQELTIEQMLPAIEKDLEMGKRHLLKTKLSIEDLTAEINAVRDRKSEVKMLANKVADLRAKIKELRNEENPFHFNLKSRQLTLDKVNNTISVDLKILEKAEADYAATLYWVKGFKRVRLFIIEQAFTTLELEINNSLAQLGMSDWQITLDVERENKSGGVTKGFVVFVQGPNNKEPVRWENWSGGETQRLQLAGDLGLANLIMVQNGLVNTFEAYDEPSQHLSPEGMMDLANLLHERAVTENKTIWIADHTSIANFGDFQGIIKIKKDDNGSSITYSGSNSRS